MLHGLIRPMRGAGMVWRLATALALGVALLGAGVTWPTTVGAVGCVVNSTADSGAGTLREKVNDASCDSITFNLPNPSTIILTSDRLLVNRPLTITGPGADHLTVARSTAIGTPKFGIFGVGNTTVTITGLTIANGDATAADPTNQGDLANYGGGIRNVRGTLTLRGVHIADNKAARGGGGIVSLRGTLDVTESTISGNHSGNDSGGVVNQNGVARLGNCTVSGNTALFGSGVVTIASSGLTASTTVTHCTVAQNTTTYGNSGGLYLLGYGSMATVRVGGSILSGNDDNIFLEGTTTLISDGDNISDDTTGAASLTATGDLNSTDPLLDPAGLQNHGGRTPTIIPLPASPAIDRIPAARCALAADQRTFPRPYNTNCDSGAVEVQPIPTRLTQVRGSATYGDTTGSATATLTDTTGRPVVGRSVGFAIAGNAACGASGTPACPITGPQGAATLGNTTIPGGLNAGNQANQVCATFAGDATHTATGPTCGPLAVTRRILWVKPQDRTVGLRQPKPPTTPPANCAVGATGPAACWLELAPGSAFVNGDGWSSINFANVRFAYNRSGNGPATEKVGAQYRITAAGALSANYDLRYQPGILRVVAP